MYQCHVCASIVSHEELSYECMCIHRITSNNIAPFRGICIGCKDFVYNSDRKSWLVKPNLIDHYLHRIHMPTEEYTNYWEYIGKNTNNGSYIYYYNTENGYYITFVYYEGPNNETYEQLIEQKVIVKPYKKTFTTKSFKGKTCKSECCLE